MDFIRKAWAARNINIGLKLIQMLFGSTFVFVAIGIVGSFAEIQEVSSESLRVHIEASSDLPRLPNVAQMVGRRVYMVAAEDATGIIRLEKDPNGLLVGKLTYRPEKDVVVQPGRDAGMAAIVEQVIRADHHQKLVDLTWTIAERVRAQWVLDDNIKTGRAPWLYEDPSYVVTGKPYTVAANTSEADDAASDRIFSNIIFAVSTVLTIGRDTMIGIYASYIFCVYFASLKSGGKLEALLSSNLGISHVVMGHLWQIPAALILSSLAVLACFSGYLAWDGFNFFSLFVLLLPEAMKSIGIATIVALAAVPVFLPIQLRVKNVLGRRLASGLATFLMTSTLLIGTFTVAILKSHGIYVTVVCFAVPDSPTLQALCQILPWAPWMPIAGFISFMASNSINVEAAFASGATGLVIIVASYLLILRLLRRRDMLAWN